MSLSLSSIRRRLYHTLFDLNTRSGRRFEGLCALFALISVVIIFVESGLGTQYHLTYDEWHLFVWLELFVTLIFTVEYLLRLISWPNPAKYVFSFWGIIDLATILPLYVMWLWPEISLNYVFAWRAMRAIRVLRILKAAALYAFFARILAGNCQRAASVDSVLFFYRHRHDYFRHADVSHRGAEIRFYYAERFCLLGDSDGHHRRIWRYHATYAAWADCCLAVDPDWLFGDCYPNRLNYYPYEYRVSKG